MARIIRKSAGYPADLIAAFNELKLFTVAQMRLAKADLATATGAGTSWTAFSFHDDVSEKLPTKPNATDLATCIVLANELRALYELHRVDDLAHKLKDTTNTITAAVCYDLTTVQALANDLKTKYNLHRAVVASHSGGADSTNTVSSANATDLATSITLLNEIKTKLNAHMSAGVTVKGIRLLG